MIRGKADSEPAEKSESRRLQPCKIMRDIFKKLSSFGSHKESRRSQDPAEGGKANSRGKLQSRSRYSSLDDLTTSLMAINVAAVLLRAKQS